MTPEHLTALVVFAFVSSITPGPNNLMLLASAANFGIRKTIPHILGILSGFCSLILLVGAGLSQIFDQIPWSATLLKVVSVAYMLWLAIRVLRTDPKRVNAGDSRPMTLTEAAAFQWVNPKGWAMALTAISVYSHQDSYGAVAMVAFAFGVVNLPCILAWTVLGHQMARFLGTGSRQLWFNRTMATLLVASLYPVLFP